MNTKAGTLLLLLLPVTASAQYAYDYTSGPITSATPFGTTGFGDPVVAPPLGTNVTGVITLSQPLPQNGTVFVTGPSVLSATFQADNFGTLISSLQIFGFTFTTTDGAVSAFQFKDATASGNIQLSADSSTDTLSYSGSFGTGGLDLTATAGGWVAAPPKVSGAPEIDPISGGAVLTLLAGALVILRGRRRAG